MAEATGDIVEDVITVGGGGGGGRRGEGMSSSSTAGVDNGCSNTNGSMWEIEEVEAAADQQQQPAGPPPLAAGGGVAAADVYVAVGKGGSSMEALSWALRHLASPRSFVFLVHIFPVVISIPTALGMMPTSQASPEQVQSYMNQKRSKRRQMLQKYLDHCRNFQVNVDVYLIESDKVADAILELIPVLHIKQLVMGVSKSNLRKLKRGSTVGGHVLKSAPLYCEVKIVCDGKEVTTLTTADPTPPVSPSPVNNKSKSISPTPLSPAPNHPLSPAPKHNNSAATDDKKETNTNERKKIAKYFRCFSL